jgi:RimJ/RimL family protein N-acetyltransferase
MWRRDGKVIISEKLMQRISPVQAAPAIRALFRTDEPQAPRCFSVLHDPANRGQIIVNDLNNLMWAVVQEPFDRSIFLGGDIDVATVADVFTVLRREGEVIAGMWLDDPRLALLPPNPNYDGRTLEFYDRPIGKGLNAILRGVPADCEIKRLDRELIFRTEWGPNDVQAHGGIDVWERRCMGYGLVCGDNVLSEATVGPPALNLYEPGVFTQPEHRGKGYGTMVVARLIQEIEAMGARSYWNCAKQNVASAAIARKLGYRVEKEYRCLMWDKVV